MMPLPLGTTPHPTDAYNVIVLLTPAKLVVGLKPKLRTWFKHPRELDADESRASKTRSRLRGTLAWFPSVILKGLPQDEKTPPKPTTPALAF
jgi:vacuolar protein sorting-associated protein 8